MLAAMASPHPFVGRTAELARLESAIVGAAAGRGALVRVVGEPGIGKTRLADEIAARAGERGMRVAWGRAWEAGGAPAYWPWTQILGALGEPALAPALGPAHAPLAVGDAEQARFRMFEALAARLARASEAAPIVVIFDDAHAADVASLVLLRLVARGLRASRLAIVVTHREVEARLSSEIGEQLAKIAREGETIALCRLSERDVGAWLEGVGRSDQAASVFRVSEGNPLFVQELLETVGAGGALPDAVRSAIGEHLARLSPAARGVLELAATFGRDATRAALAAIAGTPGDIDAALREAIALGVIEARGGDVVAFRHILLRDELHAAIPIARRAELHARVAAAFARRADHDDDALPRAAHHELEAAQLGGPIDAAIDRARQAAARALRRVAYEQAAELLGRAVQLLDDRGATTDARGCELIVEWGEALLLSGRGPAGRDACARGAALAVSLGERAFVVRAALVYGSEILTGQRDERMIALLRDAAAAVDPDDLATRACVTARLSAALIPSRVGEEEPSQLARDAIAMARRAGDRRALLYTLQFATGGLAFVLANPERYALVAETVQLARELDRPTVAVSVLPWLIAGELEAGSLAGADRAIELLAQTVAPLPPSYRVRLPIARATRALLTGRDADAETALAEATAIAATADGPMATFLLAFCRLGAHYTRGDVVGFTADHEAITKATRNTVIAGMKEALFHAMRAAAGQEDLTSARAFVRRETEQLLASNVLGALPASGQVAIAAILVEDVEMVRMLEPIIRAHALHHKMVWLGACAGCFGPTGLVLGDMAALLGDRERARADYDDAIAFCTSIGEVPYLARVRARRAALASPARAPTPAAAPPPSITLDQRGELWTLVAGDEVLHLRDSKGLAYLAALLAQPHEELHVAQLVGAGDDAGGDAGPLLDAKAKASYRQRAIVLREAIDEATARGDAARADAARAELDALGEELARAVGLGGRDRKAASSVERMRVNVQRRIKDAIERVRAQSPALGRYLDASVKTGAFCSYAPAWTGKDG
jgi:hypothetical protein